MISVPLTKISNELSYTSHLILRIELINFLKFKPLTYSGFIITHKCLSRLVTFRRIGKTFTVEFPFLPGKSRTLYIPYSWKVWGIVIFISSTGNTFLHLYFSDFNFHRNHFCETNGLY